jgi:hypothetical protein
MPRPVTRSYPEPARLSRASYSSGKAFTLDCIKARGTIFTQVEDSHAITTSFLASNNCQILLDAFQSAIRAGAPFACSFDQSVLTNLVRTHYTEGTTSCTAFFCKSRLGHSGYCHLLNLSSAYKTSVTPPPQRHTALQSTMPF